MQEKRSHGRSRDGGGLGGPCRWAVPGGGADREPLLPGAVVGVAGFYPRLDSALRTGLPSQQRAAGSWAQVQCEQTRLCLEGPGGTDQLRGPPCMLRSQP